MCGFMVLSIADGISQFKDFASGYCVIFQDCLSLSGCFDGFLWCVDVRQGIRHFGDSVIHFFLSS